MTLISSLEYPNLELCFLGLECSKLTPNLRSDKYKIPKWNYTILCEITGSKIKFDMPPHFDDC